MRIAATWTKYYAASESALAAMEENLSNVAAGWGCNFLEGLCRCLGCSGEVRGA